MDGMYSVGETSTQQQIVLVAFRDPNMMEDALEVMEGKRTLGRVSSNLVATRLAAPMQTDQGNWKGFLLRLPPKEEIKDIVAALLELAMYRGWRLRETSALSNEVARLIASAAQ